MAELIAEWHADHIRFSRLLDLLEKQMDIFGEGGQPNYELMRDIVDYLRKFPDRFHHPMEEMAFVRLVARDPSLQLPINRLLQEHRVIAQAGEELLKRLEDATQDVMIARSGVEASAATYLRYYRHHLSVEETQLLPRAAELLTDAEKTAITAAVKVKPDPLTGEDLEARYGDLIRQISPASEKS